jgi:hypothetical protein
MENKDKEHPREDDRDVEVADAPAPDPTSGEQTAEDNPQAD